MAALQEHAHAIRVLADYTAISVMMVNPARQATESKLFGESPFAYHWMRKSAQRADSAITASSEEERSCRQFPDPFMAGRSRRRSELPRGDARVAHEAAPFSALDGAAAANARNSVSSIAARPFKPGQRERFLLRLCRLWRMRDSMFSPGVSPGAGSDCCGKSSGAEFFFRSCGGAAVSTDKRPGKCRSRIRGCPWPLAVRRE